VDLCVLLEHLKNEEDVKLVSHPLLKSSVKEMSRGHYLVELVVVAVVVVVVVVEHLQDFNFSSIFENKKISPERCFMNCRQDNIYQCWKSRHVLLLVKSDFVSTVALSLGFSE
jgi:hypothetical protein